MSENRQDEVDKTYKELSIETNIGFKNFMDMYARHSKEDKEKFKEISEDIKDLPDKIKEEMRHEFKLILDPLKESVSDNKKDIAALNKENNGLFKSFINAIVAMITSIATTITFGIVKH